MNEKDDPVRVGRQLLSDMHAASNLAQLQIMRGKYMHTMERVRAAKPAAYTALAELWQATGITTYASAKVHVKRAERMNRK